MVIDKDNDELVQSIKDKWEERATKTGNNLWFSKVKPTYII